MTELFSSGRFEKDWHPSEDDLLTFVDGGLVPRKLSQINTHLDECWSCRAKAEKIQETISSFVDYFDRVITANMASPPQGWRTFAPQLMQVIDRCRRPWFLSRWFDSFARALLATPRHSRLAVAALIALVIPFLVIRFHQVSTVSADQLLQVIAKAKDERIRAVPQAVVYQKLQVRRKALAPKKDSSITWEVWNDASNNRFTQRVEDENGSRFIHSEASNPSTPNHRQDLASFPPILKELERIFKTNQMDPRNPLSSSSYGAWRRSIQRKGERVIERRTAGGERTMAVVTAAAGPFPLNAVIEAELIVRAEDWHPVEERLQVQKEHGIVDYELGEVAFDVIALNVLPPSIIADRSPPAPAVSPSPIIVPPASIPSVARAPSAAELLTAEIEAHYALHQVKACLGEPIEVVKDSSGWVEVRGLVATSERKGELTAALKGLALVKVDIQTVDEAMSISPRALPASTKRGDESHGSSREGQAATFKDSRLPIETQLERYFKALDASNGKPEAGKKAGHLRIAELSKHAISLWEPVMADAWALRRLSESFSTEDAGKLRPLYSLLLESMVTGHVEALARETSQAHRLLGPVLSSIFFDEVATSGTQSTGGELDTSLDTPKTDSRWNDASFSLFDQIEEARTLIHGLFAGSGLKTKEDEAVRRLSSGLSGLETGFQILEAQVRREFSEKTTRVSRNQN